MIPQKPVIRNKISMLKSMYDTLIQFYTNADFIKIENRNSQIHSAFIESEIIKVRNLIEERIPIVETVRRSEEYLKNITSSETETKL